MAENPAQDKTEQATPRKREQAIEEGQVPKSNELNSAIVLLSILIAFGVMSTNFTNTINYFVIYTYQKSFSNSGTRFNNSFNCRCWRKCGTVWIYLFKKGTKTKL